MAKLEDEPARQEACLVFVYGSLMPGLHNDHLMQQAQLLQSCSSLPEFTMYSLGHFPGVCARGNTAIKGMLYHVNARTLSQLDSLEGHPDWYQREVVSLPDTQAQSAWMYIMPYSEVKQYNATIVPNGDWRTFHEAVLTERQQAAPQP